MITVIDMVTGEVIQSDRSQTAATDRAIQYELDTTPMLQEIALQPEQNRAQIPADLTTISVERFLQKNR